MHRHFKYNRATRLIKQFLIMDSNLVKNIVEQKARACNYRFRVQYADGTKKVERLFIGDGTGYVCKFKKGSSRRGYPFYTDSVVAIEPVKGTDPYVMMKKNARKAASLLAVSGLWPTLQKQFADLSSLSENELADLMAIYERYWQTSTCKGLDELNAHYNSIQSEYNVFFTSRGLVAFDLYHLKQLQHKGQIISVPYGDQRFHLLPAVSSAIQKAVSSSDMDAYSERWYGSYDYSIEVSRKDDVPRAWYSAEYKGCGNGHYYLLLDATHAWFYEDD